MINRRDFLKMLGFGAAGVAGGAAIGELVQEPTRRIWQVAASAPVQARGGIVSVGDRGDLVDLRSLRTALERMYPGGVKIRPYTHAEAYTHAEEIDHMLQSAHPGWTLGSEAREAYGAAVQPGVLWVTGVRQDGSVFARPLDAKLAQQVEYMANRFGAARERTARDEERMRKQGEQLRLKTGPYVPERWPPAGANVDFSSIEGWNSYLAARRQQG